MNEPSVSKKAGIKESKAIKTLSPGDLSVFCLQLALILKAGIPLVEGLKTLGSKSGSAEASQKIKGKLGRIIDLMSDYVENGDTLYLSMRKANEFPEYMLNMVQLGEDTGKLDDVLESLGDYYEREQFLKVKIRNSMMYPVFLFIIMSVVILLLVSRVFPIFNDMLESMGGSLSEGNKAFASFSNSLVAGEYSMYIIMALAVLSIVIFIISKTKPGKNMLGVFVAYFPLTKNINKKISASRFANAMSMTLASGMDMGMALQLAVNLIDNGIFKKKFETCIKDIEAGESFANSIGKTDVFSPMYIKFIDIGQQTGNVDSVMKKIAEICDSDAETALNNATSFIEPLLVGLLSIIIGIILISVMIPLVEVMSNIA